MGYLKDVTNSYGSGLLVLAGCTAFSGILALLMGHNRALEKSGITGRTVDIRYDTPAPRSDRPQARVGHAYLILLQGGDFEPNRMNAIADGILL